MVPSLTSTDKSVCATSILPYLRILLHGRAGVAQTLLSVLWQGAVPDVANQAGCFEETADFFKASQLRVIPPYRLRLAVAYLNVHRTPLRARLHTFRRIEAEDVLGAELVLDVGVDAAEL